MPHAETDTPTLDGLARAAGAVENVNGSYTFLTARAAVAVMKSLDFDGPPLKGCIADRPATVGAHHDGRLVLEIERPAAELWPGAAPGFARAPGAWRCIVGGPAVDHGATIRHLVTPRGVDAGWVVHADGKWQREPLGTIKDILVSRQVKRSRASEITGGLALRPWTLVKIPFAPEYPGKPGERLWNRDAPRLKHPPATAAPDRLHYPTWRSILRDVGKGLDDAVKSHRWCRTHGIATGADYLMAWVASLFQSPLKPLPYLFIYSREQDTGKSTLAEALERVIVDGVVRAKQALTSANGFNGELESKVLCTVEEGDLTGVKGAYERIKEWVTSPTIQIHPKGRQPYEAANATHWIQTSNDPDGCPIDPNDTRVTMIHVRPIHPDAMVPKEELFARLDIEAPDFLAAALSFEVPPADGRLNVPVIETAEKHAAKDRHRSPLDRFIRDHLCRVPGEAVKGSDVLRRFLKTLPKAERSHWSQRRLTDAMPPEHPGGRHTDGLLHYGNLSWDPPPPGAPAKPRLVRDDKRRLQPERFV